ACAAAPAAEPAMSETEDTATSSEAMAADGDAESMASYPVTVVDSFGNELTVDSKPENIVALWNESVSNLVFIGEKPSATLAIDLALHPAYYGEDASDILMLNHNDWVPDNEQILSLEPDLVLGDQDTQTAIGEFVPMYIENYEETSADGFFNDVRTLAKVFGKSAEVEARIERLLNRAEAYSVASGRVKTIYYGFNGDADGDVWWLTKGGATCAFIQPEGSCTGEYGDDWIEVSIEGLLQVDPDIIIVEDHGDVWTEETQAALDKQAQNPLWQELTAFKNDQIHFIDRAVARPEDPLVFELWLDEIMPLAYPELFDGPLTDAEVNEILGIESSEMAESSSSFPLTITDATGQEFTFDAPPKMGCDWLGCFETLADFGVVIHAASMSPENAATTFYAPVGAPEHLIDDYSNVELWAATEVDLLLSRVPDDPYWDAFREVAPVFFLHHPSYGESSTTGYQSYIDNARILGQLTGEVAAAEAAIARFETMMDNLRSLSTPELAEQSVGMIWSDEGYYGIPSDNPFCVALADVGLGNCMGTSTGRFVEYNAEEVLSLDPDLIVYMVYDGGAWDSWTDRDDPVWPQLTAVKEGNVFDASGDRYNCCSMRGLIHSFQEYVANVIPEAGISAPGPVLDFEAADSPLVQPLGSN
ncbi:MAG: ABC transporter substrate-binding protein, partial [Chloroflexota bacterium]